MKALKLTLSLTIVLLSTTVFSTNHPSESESTISIKIGTAIQNPALVWTMYNQLDDSFLQTEKGELYSVRVMYNNTQYLIVGTYDEWVAFFLMDLSNSKAVSQSKKNN